MPSSPTTISERALQRTARPPPPARRPSAAQMMRQPVGARVELAHSSALAPRTPPRPRPGVRAACAANSSGKRRRRERHARSRSSPAGASARSSGARMSSCPSARSGAATAASSSRTQPRRQRLDARPARTGRWRTRARPRSRPACRRPRAPRARLTDRSNLALAVATGSNARRQPRQARAAPAALFCSASITWNSGWRDSERAGLSTSTSRSNGTSWWP